jgi:hypothetical protein
MILMQKKTLIPKGRGGGGGVRPAGASGTSPFSKKPRPKVEEKDVPTQDGPTGPVTGDGNKDEGNKDK